MITHNIIVSFYNCSLINYDRIFGKIWNKILYLSNKVIDPALCRVWSAKSMLVFFFITHLSSYDNIFETEAWYFLGDMKVLLGHLDWGLGTKCPHSDPADKTFFGLHIVNNVSKLSNLLLKMGSKLLLLDRVWQFSALLGTAWQSYLENLTIDNKFINKFNYLQIKWCL